VFGEPGWLTSFFHANRHTLNNHPANEKLIFLPESPHYIMRFIRVRRAGAAILPRQYIPCCVFQCKGVRSGVSAESRKPLEIEECGFLPKAATLITPLHRTPIEPQPVLLSKDSSQPEPYSHTFRQMRLAVQDRRRACLHIKNLSTGQWRPPAGEYVNLSRLNGVRDRRDACPTT
jgi:hypothetical protein